MNDRQTLEKSNALPVLSFVCRKSHNERGGNKMPDLVFIAPWIMKEPIPDPFRVMLEKAGKKTGQL